MLDTLREVVFWVVDCEFDFNSDLNWGLTADLGYSMGVGYVTVTGRMVKKYQPLQLDGLLLRMIYCNVVMHRGCEAKHVCLTLNLNLNLTSACLQHLKHLEIGLNHVSVLLLVLQNTEKCYSCYSCYPHLNTPSMGKSYNVESSENYNNGSVELLPESGNLSYRKMLNQYCREQCDLDLGCLGMGRDRYLSTRDVARDVARYETTGLIDLNKMQTEPKVIHLGVVHLVTLCEYKHVSYSILCGVDTVLGYVTTNIYEFSGELGEPPIGVLEYKHVLILIQCDADVDLEKPTGGPDLSMKRNVINYAAYLTVRNNSQNSYLEDDKTRRFWHRQIVSTDNSSFFDILINFSILFINKLFYYDLYLDCDRIDVGQARVLHAPPELLAKHFVFISKQNLKDETISIIRFNLSLRSRLNVKYYFETTLIAGGFNIKNCTKKLTHE